MANFWRNFWQISLQDDDDDDDDDNNKKQKTKNKTKKVLREIIFPFHE